LIPFVSVIVPFHNNASEIRRCCESLLNQTLDRSSYEVLFIDNGSTDGSSAIVATFDSVQLLREHRPGAYAARNLGIQSAKGTIIAFTDADCIVDRHWLATIVTAMADPQVVAVLGAYAPGDASFPASALIAYENAKNQFIFASPDSSFYYGYTNNMAVRRSVFDRYGLFQVVARGGDSILIRTLIRNGETGIRYLPGMLVTHLEFQSVFAYYGKVYIHSRSVRRLHTLTVMRPLTNAERMAAFRDMIRVENYSPLKAAWIYLVLAFGALFWFAGWLRPLPQPPGTPEGRQ